MNIARSVVHVLRVNWRHRAIAFDLITRDFRVRYLGSILGGYWNFIHPAAMIAIYTIVFSRVMAVKLGGMQENPYTFTVYLCAGLLPWTALLEMVQRGTGSFQENAHLIKKLVFPTEILQTVVTGSASITFGISILAYIGLLFVTGYGVAWPIVFLPLIFLVQVVFASGLGMILSVLNVFFRDIQQMVNIVFQVWFWLTPIVYAADRIPAEYMIVFKFNPLYYLVTLYQQIFYLQVMPDWKVLGGMGVFSIGLYALGTAMINHFKFEVADEL